MNPSSIKAYFDLFNSFYKTLTIAVPVGAWLLRSLGVIRPKSRDDDRATPIMPILGFGIVGGVLGFFVAFVCGMVGLFELGARVFVTVLQMSSSGTFQGQLPDLPVSDIFLGLGGLVGTLLAFGGSNKANGLSFILSAMMGSVVGVLTVLMVGLSFLGH